MKKEILFLCIFLLSFSIAFSQPCIPSWTQPGSGIYPDTIVNMPAGPTNVPYDFTVQFKVPLKDSSIIATGIDVYQVKLTGVTGLENIPSSVAFHYNCNPSTCAFKGDSVGCVRIQGTPTTEGVYPLTINALVYFTPVASIPVDFTGYQITISNTIGIPGLQTNRFDVGQNQPNPANSKTQLFVNLMHGGPIQVKVSNVIGNEVYRTSITGHAGVNTVSLDVSKYKAGVYFYSISDDKNSITKRMVVDK
ncbi:MAG: T9SS type A sorting domain-containing protein [Chitinophagales bacterium]